MTQDTLAVLHVRKTSSARHLSPVTLTLERGWRGAV